MSRKTSTDTAPDTAPEIAPDADLAPAAGQATAAARPPGPPRMGQTVMVRVKPGAKLRNTETGGFFLPGQDTPQTVTVTMLRRLQDGDLLLV